MSLSLCTLSDSISPSHNHRPSSSTVSCFHSFPWTVSSSVSRLINSKIAYGSAATIVLRHVFTERIPKLCALVALYPSQLPDPATTPPKSIRVQVHLAGEQPFAPRYPSYAYSGTSAGFAQRESGVYDKTSSDLAWSRTLDCIRKGFGIEVDMETIWEEHLACQCKVL